MHHHFQVLNVQHDIDLFFEKAKNGEIPELQSEEESREEESANGTAEAGGSSRRMEFPSANLESARKISAKFLESQDYDGSGRLRALPSVEASIISDMFINGSVLVGDGLNGTSRSRSELLSSKDEIQKIREEVKHIGMFQEEEAADDGRGESRQQGKDDMLLMDMRFDSSRDIMSVNTSSRKVVNHSQQRDLEGEQGYKIEESEDRIQFENNQENGQATHEVQQSAAQIISRNMTTNSFYKPQNFFSDKSVGMLQEEHFTFQKSQSDRGQRQIQNQVDKQKNSQSISQKEEEDGNQFLNKDQARNEEINWDLGEFKHAAHKSQVSAVLQTKKYDSTIVHKTTKSQVDTWHDSKTAGTQSKVELPSKHLLQLSITSNNNSHSIEQRMSSLNAPSKRHEGLKSSKPPPTSSARRLKPIQYLSNKHTYFDKVKQCNRSNMNQNQLDASNVATKSTTIYLNGSRKPMTSQNQQPPPLQLSKLNSTISGDQPSSALLRSQQNSARKLGPGPSSELQRFNDVFLDDFEVEENVDEEGQDDIEEGKKDLGIDLYGTYETSREKEEEGPPAPRQIIVEADFEKVGRKQGPSDQRQLTRRLLKSPEPNLPNYFSLKNADKAARCSDTQNYDKVIDKEMPFDSREPTPKLDDDLESNLVNSDSMRPESLPCPFRQYNTGSTSMNKQKVTISGLNNPIVNLQVSKDLGSEIKFNRKRFIEKPKVDTSARDDNEKDLSGFKDDLTSKDDYRQNSCGKDIEIESKQASDLIQQVRQTLNQRPRMFQQKSKRQITLVPKEEPIQTLNNPKTRNKQIYSPIPKAAPECLKQRSDCGTPNRGHQLIANNYVPFTSTVSQSSLKNQVVTAPEKNRKTILKSKSPISRSIFKPDLVVNTERGPPTTCPAEKHPDRSFTPTISVSLKEICDRVQILQDRFMEPKNVVEECKVTIQNQMQVIIALMEQQIKYGIDKVGIEDEITNKKFDLDATMGLLSRLEVQQDQDRRLFGYSHPDLEEPRLLCMKYELIDKERLCWIRKHNQELEEKINSLETKLRIYKRNEKYQFWGYYDIVADSQQKKRTDCNSYERRPPDSFALADFKSPETERRNIFKVSRHHFDKKDGIDILNGLPSQSSCCEPQSLTRSNKGFSIISPNSRSTIGHTKQQPSLSGKMPLAQLVTKQGSITQADINAVNKKLRELQHQLFVKERQLKEQNIQYNEIELLLKKEKQQRQVEQMEKDLKIQFLQNQIDEVYKVYKKKMKDTDPGMKSIKTLGQRLMAEIAEIPNFKAKKRKTFQGELDTESLMQLTATLLQKNHDLEQQIFALERKNDELMGLTGSLSGNHGPESQTEQQDKIIEMQECIKVLSNIFVQQKENEPTTRTNSALEIRQKQKSKGSQKPNKEQPSIIQKKLSRDDPMKKKFISRDEEDFERMLRSSISKSSNSSEKKTKKGNKTKENNNKDVTSLKCFISNINQKQMAQKKNSTNLDSKKLQQKSSKELNHVKLIPQLFNESDTNVTKIEMAESHEIKKIKPLERSPNQPATLADLILPKSKLNSQKNWISKQSPASNRARQDLSDLKVFKQTQKCSNKNAFKYQVYPKELKSSGENAKEEQKKSGVRKRDMQSSDNSMKRVVSKEPKKSKYVIMPNQVKSKSTLEKPGTLNRVASAINARLTGVSPAQLKDSSEDANSCTHMRSHRMLKDAEQTAIIAMTNYQRDKVECQQKSKTRVNSQQINKLRYLFQ